MCYIDSGERDVVLAGAIAAAVLVAAKAMFDDLIGSRWITPTRYECTFFFSLVNKIVRQSPQGCSG
jgi:hypothetical protein